MLHLILGVAGGIVLAVYAIAFIERQRERRAERRWMNAIFPPPPRKQWEPSDRAAWTGAIIVTGIAGGLAAIGILEAVAHAMN